MKKLTNIRKKHLFGKYEKVDKYKKKHLGGKYEKVDKYKKNTSVASPQGGAIQGSVISKSFGHGRTFTYRYLQRRGFMKIGLAEWLHQESTVST